MRSYQFFLWISYSVFLHGVWHLCEFSSILFFVLQSHSLLSLIWTNLGLPTKQEKKACWGLTPGPHTRTGQGTEGVEPAEGLTGATDWGIWWPTCFLGDMMTLRSPGENICSVTCTKMNSWSGGVLWLHRPWGRRPGKQLPGRVI